jgi:probable rRNA maturation factor
MKLHIDNKQARVKIEKRDIRRTVSRIFKLLDCVDNELSIVFTDDDHIKRLNRQYLGKNKATNVLSFPLLEGKYFNINPRMMGDIVISVDTAEKDARKGNLSLQQEIDFLLIHGILHLLGYNHENTSPEKANDMSIKEKELFNKIHFRNKTSI